MSSKKPANLKAIADHLGLGVTTVSDILLRGKTNYSPKTIQKVQKAAKLLKYLPNALAQGMRRGNTKTIGLLITFNILDPFFAELVNHLEDLFEREGYMVLLSISEKDMDRDRKVLDFFESRRVDGVVMGPIYDFKDDGTLYDVYKTSIPSVAFLADPRIAVDRVNIKGGHYGIGKKAAEYFLKAGHKKIGYLMGSLPLKKSEGDTPFRGFYDTLMKAGLYQEKWIWPAERPLSEFAYARMKAILQESKLEDLPTAIFCHNDHCAIGAMFAVREAGYRIPEDFSFIGTDNIITSAFAVPPLTTIDLCAKQIAAEVALLMLERLAHADRAERISVVEPRLIERNSVSQSRRGD